MGHSSTALRAAVVMSWVGCATFVTAGSAEPSASLPQPRAGLHAVEPPHRSVYSLLEDRDGFLWVGTLDGLGRYDGYEMIVFRHDPEDPSSISNNAVHVLLEDRRGVLWAGTENGLNALDRETLDFEHRSIPDLEGGGGLIITSAFEDRQGRLWFGTNRGLVLLGHGSDRFEVFKPDPDDPRSLEHPAIIGVDVDRSGALWVATSSVSACTLHRFDESGKGFDRVAVTDANRGFLDFMIDAADRVWLHPAGPLKLDSGRSEKPDLVPAELCRTPRTLIEGPRGEIWIGCDDGLYRVDPSSGSVARLLLEPKGGTYLENYVRALRFDRSGTLWVGTQGGLFRLDPNAKPFAHHGHDPERADSLSARSVSAVVEAPDGSFWVGTYGGGLNHLDPALQHSRRYCVDPASPDACVGDVIWDLHLDGKGVLWIAGAGLWSLDTKNDRIERHCRTGGLPEDGLSFTVESPAGTLWLAGNDRRLYRYIVASRTLEAFNVSGEPSREWVDPRIDSLLVRGNDLWLALGDWLARFDLSTGDLERIPLESAGGAYLGSQGTWALHERRDGSLWLGTSNGLLAYRPDRGDFSSWTTRDGLPGSAIYSILEDGEGRLWLGTNQGLSSFDPRLPAGKNFRTYTTADGIGNVEFNRHSAVKTIDHRMVFGGMDGLTHFEPSRIRDNAFVPPVRITGIDAWSRDGKRSITPYGLESLVLSHRDTTFGFTFAALSFTDPARNRYAYRLQGFEEGWVEAGTRRTCQYTNLPPGSYLFQVRGSNNDGLWNEEGTSLPVVIRPSFWQTWWFRSLVVIAVAAMIGLAVAYRRARRREMQRLRLRIADDLHDDLSSDLSGIAVVTDMVQRKNSIDPADRYDLIAVRDSALKMVDGVRDIVWYIDPEHDNLSSLVMRMRHVAELLLRGIHHQFDVRPPAHTVALSMAVRRSLLMVFKETLHNIVRHAEAQEVRIELTADGGRLRLCIVDDGKGFDIAGELNDGHGLRGMRRRAEEIGAHLEIKSHAGSGTTVTMDLDMASSRDGGTRGKGTSFKREHRGE